VTLQPGKLLSHYRLEQKIRAPASSSSRTGSRSSGRTP